METCEHKLEETERRMEVPTHSIQPPKLHDTTHAYELCNVSIPLQSDAIHVSSMCDKHTPPYIVHPRHETEGKGRSLEMVQEGQFSNHGLKEGVAGQIEVIKLRLEAG